jgi:hypothetical protein
LYLFADCAHSCCSVPKIKIAAIRRQGELVKQIALILSWLLISVAASAQTYSDASVNGKYAYRIGTPAGYTWSKTFACPTNASVTYTPYGGAATTAVDHGVATFDGAGHWSAPDTKTGRLNASASAATMSVTWSTTCQVTKVNYGHVVYLAAATTTIGGTYTVSSSGTGTLTITTGGSGSLTIQLAATNGSGISTTAILTSTQVSGQAIGMGIAVLE